MINPFWYLDILYAKSQLRKGTTEHVAEGYDWSHRKLVHFINHFLMDDQFDVRVEDYFGTHSKRFICVRAGTGKYTHAKRESNRPLPTFPGAHRMF